MKVLKKSLLAISAICMASCALGAFAACDNTEPAPSPEHAHVWNDGEVTTAATCDADGTKTYTCTDCGEKKTEPVAALGHAWGDLNVTEPTEDGTGTAVRTCARAGCDVKDSHVLPALNSGEYDVNTDDATCESDGSTVYAYSYNNVDGKKETVQFTHVHKATGHSYSQTIDTTDKSAGDTVGFTCDDCGALGKTFTYYTDYNVTTTGLINTVSAGSYYCEFTADNYSLDIYVELKDCAKYTFDFESFNEDATAYIANAAVGVANVATTSRANPVTYITDAFSGVATIDTTATETKKFTFDSSGYEGKTLTIKIKWSGENSKFTMDVTADRFVNEGVSKVAITDAGTFVDEYTFIPEESKVYSMTVPEGLDVLMNGKDLIIVGTWANFEATAGEPITFAFSYGEVDVFDVTIADEIVPPALTLDGDPITFNLTVGRTYCFEVDKDVEEGVYTVEIGGAFLTSKVTGYGALYFMVSSEEDVSYSTVTSDGLYLQFATEGGNFGNYEYDCTNSPWKVTLTLKAGDKLYFAPVNAPMNDGTVLTSPLTVKLTAAD